MTEKNTRQPSACSLLFANVLYWVCAGVYSPFLSAYYARLGLDASQTGVLLAVTPMCAIAIQPLWSLLADKFGRRRSVIIGLCAAAAIVAPLYYFVSSFAVVFVVTLLFSAFFSALLPLCDSLVIELAQRGGHDFSRIRMGGTIGYALVVLIVGQILDIAPGVQFVIVSGSLVVFAVHMSRLPEVSGAGDKATEKKLGGVSRGKGILSVFTSREIVFVLAFAFISSSGIGFIGAFLGRYSVELGQGQNLVGVLSAVSAASEVPFFLRRQGSSSVLVRFASSFFLASWRLLGSFLWEPAWSRSWSVASCFRA